MRTSAAIKRPIALVTLALTAACSSIQAVPIEFISEMKPTTVDLYTGYGRHVEITNPQLVGDTVVGTSGGLKTVSVPLAHVEQISARRFSGARTAMLVGSLTVLAALGTYMVLNDDTGEAEDLCTGTLLDVGEREACGFSMRTR